MARLAYLHIAQTLFTKEWILRELRQDGEIYVRSLDSDVGAVMCASFSSNAVFLIDLSALCACAHIRFERFRTNEAFDVRRTGNAYGGAGEASEQIFTDPPL